MANCCIYLILSLRSIGPVVLLYLYSGYICLVINGKSKPGWKEVKKSMAWFLRDALLTHERIWFVLEPNWTRDKWIGFQNRDGSNSNKASMLIKPNCPCIFDPKPMTTWI